MINIYQIMLHQNKYVKVKKVPGWIEEDIDKYFGPQNSQFQPPTYPIATDNMVLMRKH